MNQVSYFYDEYGKRLGSFTSSQYFSTNAPNGGTGEADGDLIFETPFELNETQICFVSNKDTFVNEEDAKKVIVDINDPIAQKLVQ